MKCRFAALVTLIAISVLDAGAHGGGTTAFLQVPVGARAVALGGTYTGVGEDAYAMHFNPAAFARSPRQVVFSHTEYIVDFSQEYLAYAHPLDVGVIGVSVNSMDYGDFDQTVITNTAAPNNSGSFNSIGGFSAEDVVLGVTYGRQIFVKGFNVGLTAKLIDMNVAGFSDQAFAVDLGFYYRNENNPFSFGISALNLGDKLRLQSQQTAIPRTFRVGAAYRMFENRLVVAGDVEKNRYDKEVQPHVGLEYWPARFLALRVGYDGLPDSGNGLRLGVGARIKHIDFDYAYADEDELEQSHRVSLGYNF